MTTDDAPWHYLIYVYVAPPPEGDAVPTSLCPGARKSDDPLTPDIHTVTCLDCLDAILRIDLGRFHTEDV